MTTSSDRILKVKFHRLSNVFQDRFLRISPLALHFGLRRTNSYMAYKCEHIHGEKPVDQFSLRKLAISSPIRFNQIRICKGSALIEYVADPNAKTYNEDEIRDLKIYREISFFNVTPQQIKKVVPLLDLSTALNLNIFSTIRWKEFKKLLEPPRTTLVFDGMLEGALDYADFFQAISHLEKICLRFQGILPANFEKALMMWAEKLPKDWQPKEFSLIGFRQPYGQETQPVQMVFRKNIFH